MSRPLFPKPYLTIERRQKVIRNGWTVSVVITTVQHWTYGDLVAYARDNLAYPVPGNPPYMRVGSVYEAIAAVLRNARVTIPAHRGVFLSEDGTLAALLSSGWPEGTWNRVWNELTEETSFMESE